MLSVKQAINIVMKNIPNGKINHVIVHDGLYIFKVFFDDELEGEMDPFYSVNIETGEFRDFSIITDGDIHKIVELFNKTNKPKK